MKHDSNRHLLQWKAVASSPGTCLESSALIGKTAISDVLAWCVISMNEPTPAVDCFYRARRGEGEVRGAPAAEAILEAE